MKTAKRILSAFMAMLIVLSCWVWIAPESSIASAANSTLKDHYLFAYFTGTSKEGQTIHLAVSDDGYNYTALRNNEPVIIPSKGVGNVRDPYIWYNEQDNYYYILATDLDFTDGGGTYSNNSQSFIIWRSKDLVNWYDETFIDVSKMAHLIGDTRNMSAVWAPQVLWDGSAYVVYFTLACNATSWFDIVYLKTTDLMNPDAYYEFDYILGNGTGNGTDNGYGVIDADIIHNPGDGKYYLFYKTECNAHELGTTNTGSSLKTVHYYVGDTPTGPFTNPGDNKWNNCGFSIFPNYNVSLEGCNSFFDNDGNLIMYVDEFEHTNAAGEAEAYFHIAKSNGYDFTSWSYPDVSQHNINSLSPRHGSVVKITEAEYNRLLNNSYNISSSSYPETETLKDHLVARYFTTDKVLWNDVVGKPNLASSSGITMMRDNETGEYYASFDSTNGGWAEVDFDSLFLNGLNYEDGFTITFKAMLQPNSATNNENNDRIYEIADVFGSRTGTEHYTHFSPGGGGNGTYLGNYNGPVDSGNDWLNDKDRANRDDKCFHEYIISYATGNVMVYVDGELVISRNRFTGVKLDDSWYQALGSNSTMRIGKSGWDADPLFKGRIQDLCIYDCSMSYYDAKSVDDEFALESGWVGAKTYNGITSVVPTFQNTGVDKMNTLPNKEQHFSNILYSSETVRNFDGNNMSEDSAIYHYNGNDFYFAIYYPETTVLMLDGINEAVMPVSFGSYCENKRGTKGFYQVYPTTGPGSTTDHGGFEISQNWGGWYNNGDYYNCIVEHADGYIGRNSTTTSWSYITNKANYDCHWGAPLKVNEDEIDLGGAYYKKYYLSWQVNGGVSGTYAADHSGNFTSNHVIYVVDFRPVLQLRNTITEDMYNEVVNNTDLCYELRAKYASAVKDIRTMNPSDFGISGNGALTASKAFAKAISEAVGTYNGVMAEIEREKAAGTYGHQCTEFAARAATCEKNGLTEGRYCVLCGEIVKEQEVLAPLPHSFGAVFTENGVQYKQCSVCGVKIEYQPSEARYENLFSLNRWLDSASNGVFNGTISNNRTNGTITIVNNYTTEIYTRATFDGQNLVATRDFGNYCIPVTGGNTYVVEATSLASSTSGGEVFIFQYNKDGLAFSAIPTVLGLAPGQTAHNEFTVDKNAAYIELRFDCNDAGKTITYDQIGIYKKENFDKFGADTADARLGFYPGDSKDLCRPNPADGYVFDGWYTSNGVRIENVNQLNNPTTIVYGKWIAAGYNIVYDSLFSFADWAKSSCNLLWYGDSKDANGNVTRLVSSEGILADASKGTITITNDADTTYFARTNYWVDSGNVHKMTLEQNTDYIIEYTATSSDGAKPSICAYITGGTAQYPESGATTRYGTGKHYFRIQSGDNTKLTLRFDNVQHGSTVTFSDIAVYKAEAADHPEYFLDHAQNITNRQYFRYYEQKGMGIGDVFEYTPVRPGYTFSTWKADTNGDNLGDFEMKGFDDTFKVENNWHLFSEWTENSYTIKYNANGGSGSVADQTVKYTEFAELAKEGFTRTGHVLAGWSTDPNSSVITYQLGQTVSRLTGDANGTVTLYAVWAKEFMNVTFDNLIDMKAWAANIENNSNVSDITDTGFSVSNEANADEKTISSPFFKVTPGKDYMIDIDITGNNWDVYIFFCNASGGWVDFVDGESNRYSPYTTWDHIFTAPDKDEVVKAQIRVDANTASTAHTVNFDNIRVYEYDGISPIEVTPSNALISAESEFGTLPTPTKEGYDFLGWYDENNNKITADSIVPNDADFLVPLHSEWAVNNEALETDLIVVDFGTPVEFNPISNDTILNKEAAVSNSTVALAGISAEGSDPASTLTGDFGSFRVSNNKVVYTPSKAINAEETLYYHATITENGTARALKAEIVIVPASNVLYEETLFTQKESSGDAWETVKNASVTANGNQSVSTKDDVIGYDESYNASENYSNDSALSITLTPDKKRSKIVSFDFSGTGFDLYGVCGPTTGVQIITLKDNTANKMVGSYIVDTYYSDANYGTLYQVPVLCESGLEYSNYTVQVVATYVSFAGAMQNVSTQAVDGTNINAYTSSDAQALRDALAEVGMEYVLDAENVEVIWFDDDSIFNGGNGVNTAAEDELGTQAVSLINVVDSIRVYKPLDDDDRYYGYTNRTETGAQYYNVMDNLVNGGAISGSGIFAYVSNNPNEEIKQDTYDSIGSKDELYISNATTNAVTFTVTGLDENSRVMISLRAASGTPVVKVGGKQMAVTSNTEMYFDITDYVADDGTVTIQNASGNTKSLLAIGSVKITGATVSTMSTTFNLMTARTMMMAPATETDFNAPIVEEEEIIPDDNTPDDTTPDDTNPDNSGDEEECWIIRLIKWIIGMFEKLIKLVTSVLSF